jgi:hypothetical protein
MTKGKHFQARNQGKFAAASFVHLSAAKVDRWNQLTIVQWIMVAKLLCNTINF